LDPTPVPNYKLASVGFAKIAKVYGSLIIYIIYICIYLFSGYPELVHVEEIYTYALNINLEFEGLDLGPDN